MLHCDHIEHFRTLLPQKHFLVVDFGQIIQELTPEYLILWRLQLPFKRWFSHQLSFLLQVLLFLHEHLVLLINEFLLPLNIFEHILIFGENHIIWKHLRVLFVKLEDPRESFLDLSIHIYSLQIFWKVIEDEVVLENRDNMSVLIVHYITHNFWIVIVLGGEIFLVQTLSHDSLQMVHMRALLMRTVDNAQTGCLRRLDVAEGAGLLPLEDYFLHFLAFDEGDGVKAFEQSTIVFGAAWVIATWLDNRFIKLP